jgi:hypothetical protein
MIKKLRNQPYAPKGEEAPKCGSKGKKKDSHKRASNYWSMKTISKQEWR